MVRVNALSAVTLRVTSMEKSLQFYRDILGLSVFHAEDTFTAFGIGGNYLNLQLSPGTQTEWGRVILYCDDVDQMHAHLVAHGLDPPTPIDAPWGERLFHVRDPDGHEISLAQSRI